MASQVLQEYLIKLGYQVDAIGFRRFDQNLSTAGKRIIGVGTAVAGVVAATAAATTAFAYDMRKMYFASELANTSVKNLKSMEYAGKQVGVSSDEMAEAILHVGRALRGGDIGFKALINGLGISTDSSREANDVLMELLETTKQFPEEIAASMLNIPVDTYHMLIEDTDKLKNKTKEANDIQEKFGLNFKESESTVMHYTSSLDRLGFIAEGVGKKFLLSVLPVFDQAESAMEDFFSGYSKYLDNPSEYIAKFKKFMTTNVFADQGPSKAHEEHKARTGYKGGKGQKGIEDQVMDFFISKGYASEDAAAIAANLYAESKFDPHASETLKGGGKGRGRGLAQWTSKDRIAAFEKIYGKIEESSLEDQLSFVDMELKGTHKSAYNKMMAAKGAGAKGAAISRYYESPADSEGQAALRSGIAEEFQNRRLGAEGNGIGGTNVTNNNTWNITGSDAKQIADSVAQKQDRVNANTARQLSTTYR